MSNERRNFFGSVLGSASADESPVEISPQEVKQKLDAQESFELIDCRQANEFEGGHIAGAKLIPLNELPQRVGEIDSEREVIVYCHHGRRSLNAVQLLRQIGIPHAQSMTGGIDQWSVEIDSSIPRY